MAEPEKFSVPQLATNGAHADLVGKIEASAVLEEQPLDVDGLQIFVGQLGDVGA